MTGMVAHLQLGVCPAVRATQFASFVRSVSYPRNPPAKPVAVMLGPQVRPSDRGRGGADAWLRPFGVGSILLGSLRPDAHDPRRPVRVERPRVAAGGVPAELRERASLVDVLRGDP